MKNKYWKLWAKIGAIGYTLGFLVAFTMFLEKTISQTLWFVFVFCMGVTPLYYFGFPKQKKQ